ncbi:DUF6377 domain-containing protein [Chitinophaga sp. sic0106]|uniref:DUF6377 domain-containing protein n=1 Tax=Chitinophaga sp. sic0106 TaxID=2854785 RepID=UPI001C447D29|nr:DUF6377 domain-containing protein [Chitinophaga sp. sic0106]MBV7528588.1 tetratricopeptide repeat protein [Chitinophaga sp. sic0106]
MRRIFGGLFFTLLSLAAHAKGKPYTDSILQALNQTIERAAAYDSIKIKKIDSIRRQRPQGSPELTYNYYQELYEAYKIFNFDSAFSYGSKMQQLGHQLNDPVRIANAKVKLGFILLSSGMFMEASGYISTVDINGKPDDLRVEYYKLKSRFYSDMAAYNQDRFFSPEYMRQAIAAMDSALQLMDSTGFEYLFHKAEQLYKRGDILGALATFPNLNDPAITERQVAVAACSLGSMYQKNQQRDTAIYLMARSAIADIRTSTKETMAAYTLATFLFELGDIKTASRYIERAMTEAVFYGARQRKVMVSNILPIIEEERINTAEQQNRSLIIYAAIVTLLFLALVAMTIIVFRQIRKLKQAQLAITKAHMRQQEANNQLEEANKIKEEYIGYFFHSNAKYIGKIEKIKQLLEQKLAESKSATDFRFLINSINVRQERDELFTNFDRVFLRIFPHFVDEFNKLFDADNKVQLKENELLNTDLRIFALIRIGITDNEQIARILEYSVNTIYAYKTKIKKRSLIPNEAFEERIMAIKAL